ncbi:hypothetical protein [Halovivax gelatinilyticus]|uniref:hypothetical protein n=1 Tax=Halovivax gelatinilyticus TaxID=2961597 RepID=UPI0020CA50B2|nr:hypothetical protein [Halovivax gelatinilyticus]
MIEAKLGTEFDPEQLQEEHDDLQRFGRAQKHLFLVSGHDSQPASLDDLDLEHAEWLGWREIAIGISRCDRSKLSKSQQGLLDLLRSKLEEEGYVPFTGFPDQLLDDLPTVWELSKQYHRYIARFHRDVEGRLSESGLQAKNMWRDGISQDFNRFPGEMKFVPTHLWIAYGKPEFAINNKNQHYLFVAFCVEGRRTPAMRVGYSVSPKQSEASREMLIECADEIVEFLTEHEWALLCTDWNFNVIDRVDEPSEMTTVLKGADALGDFDRVQIAAEYDPERLADHRLAEQVADDLVEFHKFTLPRLYP